MNARRQVPLRPGQPAATPGKGIRILRPLVERLEETAEDDTAFGQRQEEALMAARRLTSPLTPRERDLPEQLADWARQAQDRQDPKFGKFRDWLDKVITPGSPERVIVFTEYRATEDNLRDWLAASAA